jgi:hypothetical protein
LIINFTQTVVNGYKTMTQKQTQEKTSETPAKFKVFGNIPDNTIYLPQTAFGVRNDCRIGQWKQGKRILSGEPNMI